MPSLKTLALAAGPVLLLGGCGGDAKSTTVVKTVIQKQAAPPPTTPPVTPTTPPTTPTTPGATTTTPAEQPKPVANLPAGTPAVSGEFAMKIIKATEDTFIRSEEDVDEERKWFAAMRCDGTQCTVELRRELPQGGFKTLTLREDGDPRRYAATSVGGADFCSTLKPVGPPKQRLSIRITGTQDVGGQETATRLDGYLTVQQHCANNSLDERPRAVSQYRGGRPYQGTEEQQLP